MFGTHCPNCVLQLHHRSHSKKVIVFVLACTLSTSNTAKCIKGTFDLQNPKEGQVFPNSRIANEEAMLLTQISLNQNSLFWFRIPSASVNPVWIKKSWPYNGKVIGALALQQEDQQFTDSVFLHGNCRETEHTHQFVWDFFMYSVQLLVVTRSL